MALPPWAVGADDLQYRLRSRVGRGDEAEQQLARLGELGDALGRARAARAVVGVGEADRRRKRRCTSSRSTSMPERRPSTSIAQRRSDGHAAPLVGRRGSPRRRRPRTRRERPQPGQALEQAPDLEPLGEDAGPRERGVDEAERDAAARRRQSRPRP